MGTRKTPVVTWLGVGIMVCAICFVGCDGDKPTKPEPEVLNDYRVYMKEGFDPGWIFAYHPVTNTVDSFYWLTDGQMIVSADGRMLYCRPDDSSTVAAVDLDSIQCGDTLAIDHMLPFRTVVAVSPNNQLMAVLDSGTTGFSIVNSSDYSVVFHNTDRTVGTSAFTHDSRRFYSSSGLFVDLTVTPPVTRRWTCPFGRLDYLLPSKDESVWYLMVKISGYCKFNFVAYDPKADSVLYRQYLNPGFGKIAQAPDDRVLFTNPGIGPFTNCTYAGSPFLHVYDPVTNSANDTIWATGVCSLVEASPIGELVITPDKRWMVGIHPGFGEILTFNLETMRLEKCYSLGHGHSLRYLSCQQVQ